MVSGRATWAVWQPVIVKRMTKSDGATERRSDEGREYNVNVFTSSSLRRFVASSLIRLKRKGHPREEKLPVVVEGDGVVAGEEDPVAERQRDVAGDLPVHVKVRLDAEEALVARRLVDRSVLLELVEDEEVDAGLESAQGPGLVERE